MPSPFPLTVPVGRTARRVEWGFLPPGVRADVERRIGTRVVEAVSQTSGYTPGLASVLVGADGSRHFLKAASVKAQAPFAQAYREEARKLAALPPAVPAPRLLWTAEVEGWVLLALEHVEQRHPARPWTRAELDRCLDALVTTTRALTPPPAGLALDTFVADFEPIAAAWDVVARRYDVPRAADARALASRVAEVGDGTTMVHTDLRDDNVLLADDGRVLFCDWNWPVVGPAWLDALILLVGPCGDGVDVEAVLAEHPAFAELPADAVDVCLALFVGYFLKQASEPVPTSSPHLRDFQLWQGEVLWAWLCRRRDW